MWKCANKLVEALVLSEPVQSGLSFLRSCFEETLCFDVSGVTVSLNLVGKICFTSK